MDPIDVILSFWFEGIDDRQKIDQSLSTVKRWFIKDDSFDLTIRQMFESDFRDAVQGQYGQWEQSPRGRLALIILFDQFSRNMYRNSPKMFETDPQALRLAINSIDDGFDRKLQQIERAFLCLPLMHSEEIDIQKMSVQYYEKLLSEVRNQNPLNIPYFENTLTFAQRHFDIIERFRRFPHRNDLLKRMSSQEEIEFLRQPGSSF